MKRREIKSPVARGGMNKGMGMLDKPKNFKVTMRKLLTYLRPYKLKLCLVFICALLSTIFTVSGPKILGLATTQLFAGYINLKSSGTGIDFNYIGNLLIILLILYLVSALFLYIQGYILAYITKEITYNFRKEIVSKINKLPLKYFDKISYGDVLSRITNDVNVISSTLNQSLVQIIISVTTVIGIFIMMLSISFTLTFIILIMLPFTFFLIRTIIKKSQRYFRMQQETLGNINGYIEEIYSGHNIIKAFNREEATINEFNKINNDLYYSSYKSQFLSGLIMPLVNFVNNLGFVLGSIFGGFLVVKGKINVGDIQAFIQYVRRINQPVAQVSNMINILQSTVAAAERVFEFLDEKEEASDIENYISIDILKGKIEFSNVNFSYNGKENIIKDLSVIINPGEKVALVGPTGAGKTTIVNLLMRFYELDSGVIKIDDIDIKEMRKKDLRKMIGMVLQNSWIFNASIKENIAYGKLDASDEEIEDAAKFSHLDHFINTLPNGYNMVINEEASNLSSGERQLLTIARVILSNPAILVLDEATSSVDTRTEKLIQKAMQALMKGRTSLIIAHRLSTIRDADKILVINDGKIVEIGNHDELLLKKGFYYELYNSQFDNI
ncbi:MAG: ABC transporter ATP-binding protein [Bacilli bacterium]|nr:ABC transporter ATP-binding protein [Bacilli bacterium]